MINKIKVGDRIEVEDAWEDEGGGRHDEVATVLAIDEKGFMELDFGDEKINSFLESASHNVEDYQECIITD